MQKRKKSGWLEGALKYILFEITCEYGLSPGRRRQEIAKILQLMEKANIPGLAIAVIRNNEPIWIHGFGRKNVNTPGLVSP